MAKKSGRKAGNAGAIMAPKKTKKSGKKAGNAGGGADVQALLGLLLGKAMGNGGGGGGNQKDLKALLGALGGGATGGGGGRGGGAATNSNLASFEGDWKSALAGAFGSTQGRTIKKEEITYETVQVEGEGKSGQKYQSTVTLDGQSFNGKIGLGKAGAEKNAAKVALMEMFPDYEPKQRGIKRDADGTVTREPNSREKLHQALAIFSQSTQKKNLTKDSVTYDTPEGDGQRTSTVKINVATIKKQFQGKGDTRKLAEGAAAETALKGLAKQLDSVVAAYKAKKKAAAKASIEALKEKASEKKAAKQGLS